MFRLHRCFNQSGHVTQLYISKQSLKLPLRATWPNIWGTNYMFTRAHETDRKESPWCQKDTRDEKPSARPPKMFIPLRKAANKGSATRRRCLNSASDQGLPRWKNNNYLNLFISHLDDKNMANNWTRSKKKPR